MLSCGAKPIWWAIAPREKALKFPNPVYDHRVISGLTADQLAKLEAVLGSAEMCFRETRWNDLTMPADPKQVTDTPPPELKDVPCLQIWWENAEEDMSTVHLVSFAKSPKRDAATGLYTVHLRILLAVAYAKDLEEGRKGWQRKREVGVYFTSRRVRDLIDDVLGLYPGVENGVFVKMGECAAFKDEELAPSPVPPPPVSSPWAQTRLSRPDRLKNLREQLRSNADQPPGLRTELSP